MNYAPLYAMSAVWNWPSKIYALPTFIAGKILRMLRNVCRKTSHSMASGAVERNNLRGAQDLVWLFRKVRLIQTRCWNSTANGNSTA